MMLRRLAPESSTLQTQTTTGYLRQQCAFLYLACLPLTPWNLLALQSDLHKLCHTPDKLQWEASPRLQQTTNIAAATSSDYSFAIMPAWCLWATWPVQIMAGYHRFKKNHVKAPTYFLFKKNKSNLNKVTVTARGVHHRECDTIPCC